MPQIRIAGKQSNILTWFVIGLLIVAGGYTFIKLTNWIGDKVPALSWMKIGGTAAPTTTSTPSCKSDELYNTVTKACEPKNQVKSWTDICPDGVGTFKFAVTNSLNSTGREYISANLRLYRIVANSDGTTSEVLENSSMATSTSGLTSGMPLVCGQKYAAYLPSSSTVAGFRQEFTMDGLSVSKIWSTQDITVMMFRVYDELNRAYVYEYDTANVTTMQPSGKTFGSTTQAVASTPIGTGGYYRYTFEISTNSTQSSVSQWEDQGFLYANNITAGTTDWQKPIVTAQGATVKDATCPNNVIRLGFDWCFEITKDTIPLHIASTPSYVTVEQHSPSGVNPTTSVTHAFFTGGYYQSTLSEDMKIGYEKDDTTNTLVRTGMYANTAFS